MVNPAVSHAFCDCITNKTLPEPKLRVMTQEGVVSYSGLFYEILDPKEFDLIKLGAIYFDKVFILTPVTLVTDQNLRDQYHAAKTSLLNEFKASLGLNLPDQALSADPEVLATLNLQSEAQSLIKEDVVRVINPFEEGFLRYNLRDEVISGIENRKSIEEPSQMSFSRARATKYVRESSKFSGVSAFQSRPVFALDEPEIHLAPSFQERWFQDFAATPAHDWSTSVDVRGTKPRIDCYSTENLISIKGDTLRKIMLRSAQMVSARYQAYPIATDEYIDGKFWKDLIDGVKDLPAEALAEVQRVLNDKRNVKAFRILSETVGENLPSFSNLSFNEVLEARHNFADELSALRIYLKKLAATIQIQDDAEAIASDIKNIVATEVNPAIIDLRRRIQTAKQKLPHKMLDKLALTSTSTICATVMANIPLWYSPLITSAILGGIAVSETYREMLDIRTNSSLSFILRLNRRRP